MQSPPVPLLVIVRPSEYNDVNKVIEKSRLTAGQKEERSRITDETVIFTGR